MKVTIKVKPGSSKNEVVEDGSVLTVSLRANPENGKANAALICVLADHYSARKSDVRILTGATSRKKIVEVNIGGPEGT
jgi:uncharacterized protein (TIGR00251 family)